MSDKARARCFPADKRVTTELGSKAAEGAGVGALTGGGLAALLAGFAAAAVAVPLLPMIAIGPLAAAVAGGATGGVARAIVGALVGGDIPEERARIYDRGIAEGSIVMGVTPRSDEDAAYIEREWRDAAVEQIYWPAHEEARRRR